MIPPIPAPPDSPSGLTLRLDEHRRVFWSFRLPPTAERLDEVRSYVAREQARGDLTFDPKLVGWEWT